MIERIPFVEQVNSSPEIAARFGDLHPGYDKGAAIAESDRCLYCFDAPCTTACPTHIDVPGFIKKIASGNLTGAVRTILDANILGASCARACPTEVLCEGACVLHHSHRKPIHIGRLQRYAMETMQQGGAVLPFAPAADTGRSVALVGAGPASLACAAELRRRGIQATLYDAGPLPGGLNTYGVAEYKLPLIESLREIDLLSQLGIDFRFDTPVDETLLQTLERDHDAIFLGMGLGAGHRLGIPGEALAGIADALTFIAAYKAGQFTSMPPRVAVVGAGNTAIDAAIASLRLGAAEVSLLYRRGPENISAFAAEYEHAKAEGVRFLWYVQPVAILGEQCAETIRLQRLVPTLDGSLLPAKESEIDIPVDRVLLAIGQATNTSILASFGGAALKIRLERGRILINRATGQTSQPNFFAGGDCTNGGREVVDAVADGKRAGIGIAVWLEGQHARV